MAERAGGGGALAGQPGGRRVRGPPARDGRAEGGAGGGAGGPWAAGDAGGGAGHRQDAHGAGAGHLRRAAPGAGTVGALLRGQGMPPYWPWVQAIRAYVRERDAQRGCAPRWARARPTSPRSSPTCASASPTCPRPPPLETPRRRASGSSTPSPPSSRARPRAQPLVLILDDLHWADKPSLAALAVPGGGAGVQPALGRRRLPRRGALAASTPWRRRWAS